MSVSAKISELIAALEFESEEHQTWFDRQTGQIVVVDKEVMTALKKVTTRSWLNYLIGKRNKSRSHAR